MNAYTTGHLLSELRKEKGMTQKELALQIHVTDKAVSRWETGKGFPDITSLTALSELFDITINELLAGKRIDQTIPSEAEQVVAEVVKENSTVKKHNRLLIFGMVFLVLVTVFVFRFDVFGWLSHRIQGGYTVVTVSSDIGTIDSYSVRMSHQGDSVDTYTRGNGIYYQSDYGDYRGTLFLSSDNDALDGMMIDFGLFNPNNWHKLHLHIHITENNGQVSVRQTVSCLTDNNAVLFSEKADTYIPENDRHPDVYVGLL